jgi:hypothetical protein
VSEEGVCVITYSSIEDLLVFSGAQSKVVIRTVGCNSVIDLFPIDKKY